MNELTIGQLTRLSLGRMAFIGELYDLRSESLSSRSLLKGFPTKWIERTDMNQMDFEYKFLETTSDRFDLLKVQGELQGAVLLGLIKLSGSAKFLQEEAKSEKVVSCSLVCKLQTCNEKLLASFEEMLPYVDLMALKDPQFTHVVVEVSWGANCLLTLEASCGNESKKKDIKGQLNGELMNMKRLLDLKMDGKVEKAAEDMETNNNINVRVSADVLPEEGWPTTAEGFCQFVGKVPNLLKNVNGGKGKPLSYVMIPLDGLRRFAMPESTLVITVKNIDESFLTSLILYFEDLALIKQKFHDLLKMMTENENFVPAEKLKEAREKQRELLIKESELRNFVSQDWVSVRSGEKTLRELMRSFEHFKSRVLSLFEFENFVTSCSSLADKLSRVKTFKSRGVTYLGKGDKFEDLQRDNHSSEFIVLVTSTQMEKADPELYRKTSTYFMCSVTYQFPNTIYVVVDFDYGENNFLNKNINRVTIFHLKGVKVLSNDYLEDYLRECEINYGCPKPPLSVDLCKHKPGNRVTLEIPCPGFQVGTCPPEPVKWTCLNCKTNLEYGFDDNYYCTCGKAPAVSYHYRCKNSKHGDSFTSASPEFLKKVLGDLRPLKEMNLLVIGQSGVGKSTWINSIVNYLTYDSLEAAKESGAIAVIPAKLTMFDPNTKEKRVIQVGPQSDNEVIATGQSATQRSCTYSFLWEDRCVRIIDTPGLGDTRGFDQDRSNILNVVNQISHLKELHGVCILLKANENRMNKLFTYCVKELLVHLHKNVTKNIVFCFTCARNSFYSPGSASSLLEKLLEELEVAAEFGVGKHNRFCLDNEAFLFLCALENGITFEETLAESFGKSWEISLQETRRLFKTVKDYQPHNLKETISLVKARMRVLLLTKPLADVSKTIQINLNTWQRKQKEVENKKMSLEELKSKLNFTEIHFEPEPLSHPRTVCTNSGCVSYITYKKSDIKEVEYRTICHNDCNLNDVTPKTVNNPALRGCLAMGTDGNCKKCGCSWTRHMHLTYSQKRVEKDAIDKNVETDIKKEMTEKEEIERLMQQVQDRIDIYKEEEQIIVNATAKFGLFLKKNAIAIYNDSLEEYLELLIREEENKPYKTKDEKELLEMLKEKLERYRCEVKILNEAMEAGSQISEELTPEGVFALEKKLYELKYMGETIKKFMKVSTESIQMATPYVEQQIEIQKPKCNSLLTKGKKMFEKFWF